MDQIPTFLYPHEAPEKMLVRGNDEKWINSMFWSQMLDLGLFSLNYAWNRLFDHDMKSANLKVNQLYNGKKGAEILSHKYRFAQAVDAMGYLIPASQLVPAGSTAEEIQKAMNGKFTGVNAFICKPIDGDKGRGIERFASTEKAVTFLAGQSKDYLLQEIKGPGQDWRYIFHRDGEQVLREEDSLVWRIAYQKVRPEVVGDGVQTVIELLKNKVEVPARSRKKVIQQLTSAQKAQILPSGESRPLIQNGNIAQGAYGKLPEIPELNEMDAFMYRFHRKLEAQLGVRLATACYDVGVLEANGPVALKDRVVFFEAQLPFGFFGYLRNLPHKKVKPFRIFLRFCRSIAYSSRQKHRHPGIY